MLSKGQVSWKLNILQYTNPHNFFQAIGPSAAWISFWIATDYVSGTSTDTKMSTALVTYNLVWKMS